MGWEGEGGLVPRTVMDSRRGTNLVEIAPDNRGRGQATAGYGIRVDPDGLRPARGLLVRDAEALVASYILQLVLLILKEEVRVGTAVRFPPPRHGQ